MSDERQAASRARFARVRAIYEDSLDQAEEQRADWARAACGDDAALWKAVAELLGARAPVEGFIQPPPAIVQRLASSPLESGARLGEFTLERRLASGGMGEVWIAQQEEPRRLVALKTLRDGFGDEGARRRFRFEADVLARLSHPGIAAILAAGTHTREGQNELPWFAMEYVEDGSPLVDFAEQHALGARAAVELFLEVCEAVQYGHGKGVIHRDLKPDNVLVDAQGRPRVIDFGIARAVEPDETRTQLTQAGDVLGTLQCMAPEQLTGDQERVDIRADVYALGSMLYELVCGRTPLPISGQPLSAAITAVLHQHPADPCSVAPALPADLGWVLLRALEKEPERRYPTVAALADDLRRWLDDEPVSAGPPSVRYRAAKWLRRNRGLAAAVALVLLIGLVTGTVAWQSRASARDAHEALLDESLKLVDLRLADRLHELADEAESLYPCTPARIPDLERWFDAAQELLPGLRALEETLVSLGEPTEPADRWLLERLSEDAVTARAFVAPSGELADVRTRLERARQLESSSMTSEDAARAWSEAQASIADRELCPLYDGYELTPQLGLLPLGRNPESELWEFWHTLSGERPEPGPNGDWLVEPATGVVLILLPGGSFRMGASDDDTLVLVDSERPAKTVELSPYFLARHELTRAQWARVHGGPASNETQPIERISWFEATEGARRLDLVLPTEAQWEYAVRAGTTTPWCAGDTPPDFSALGALDTSIHSALPVGSYPPNPWGFHDMPGNVLEWCRDVMDSYTYPVAPQDGLRLAPENERSKRTVRGAMFSIGEGTLPYATRASVRWSREPGNKEPVIGVRLARHVDA